MRALSLRTVVAALGVLAVGAGSALVACGSGSSPSGGGEDAAAEGNAPGSPDAGDSSAPPDATLPIDAGDASVPDGRSDAPSDGGASDASDAGMMFDFGLDAASGCAIGPKGEPTDLACTGLYSDWASKTVSADLKPYAPGLSFWSDGAQKSRWIYLPPGQKIDTSIMDEWTFPVGTKIWKEFRLPLEDGGANRVETRILWKLSQYNWYRTTYVWSADGTTSATELTSGELDAGGTGYEIPAQVKCNQCHNGRIDGVLGLEAISMASPAATGLTMATLVSQGLVTDAPDASLVVPGDAVESAALSWLHSNCGTACHNSGRGQAENTGFWMRLDVATLGSVQTTEAYTTGWNKMTLGFPIPDAAVSYRLHACDTASSCVYFRAGHRDGIDGTPSGTQMPPVDTHVVDTVDLASVAAWINEGCDAGP